MAISSTMRSHISGSIFATVRPMPLLSKFDVVASSAEVLGANGALNGLGVVVMPGDPFGSWCAPPRATLCCMTLTLCSQSCIAAVRRNLADTSSFAI